LDAANGQLKVRQAELAELKASRQDEIEQAEARLATAQAQLTFHIAKLERAKALGQSISRELLEEEIAAATAAKATQREAEAAVRLVRGAARDQKTEVARGWVAAQQAEVERLSEQFDRHTMYAPFDGWVTAEHTEIGQWVMQGDPVAEIVELDSVDVEIFVLEDYIGHLDTSAEYPVEVPSLPREKFMGQIALIVPQADARARTFPVKVRVPNRMDNNQPLLKAGMLARLTLKISEPVERMMVHKDAIVLGGATPVVYVASALGDKSEVRLVPVEIGVSEGGWIEVKGKINRGDLVVVEGNERIRPGQPVRAVEKEIAYP
jgi:RND family efflux transporter MFP subunit